MPRQPRPGYSTLWYTRNVRPWSFMSRSGARTKLVRALGIAPPDRCQVAKLREFEGVVVPRGGFQLRLVLQRVALSMWNAGRRHRRVLYLALPPRGHA